jgi:hypothetical protein
MKDIFTCTCGFETESEASAIRHAVIWHAKDGETNDQERLKARIRTMIYSIHRGFSFDEQQEQQA